MAKLMQIKIKILKVRRSNDNEKDKSNMYHRPACENEDTLKDMCIAGMNVARLNFSHGTHEEHKSKIELVKKVRTQLNMPIAIMLDTKGPEYRIKTFENGKITLSEGDTFIFTTDEVIGNQQRVSVNYDHLIENLTIGDMILVNNGLIICKVVKLERNDAICEVVVGGELSDRKSMNFPNKVMNHNFLSEQDNRTNIGDHALNISNKMVKVSMIENR